MMDYLVHARQRSSISDDTHSIEIEFHDETRDGDAGFYVQIRRRVTDKREIVMRSDDDDNEVKIQVTDDMLIALHKAIERDARGIFQTAVKS